MGEESDWRSRDRLLVNIFPISFANIVHLSRSTDKGIYIYVWDDREDFVYCLLMFLGDIVTDNLVKGCEKFPGEKMLFDCSIIFQTAMITLLPMELVLSQWL